MLDEGRDMPPRDGRDGRDGRDFGRESLVRLDRIETLVMGQIVDGKLVPGILQVMANTQRDIKFLYMAVLVLLVLVSALVLHQNPVDLWRSVKP